MEPALLHAIAGILLMGYSMEYYFHLQLLEVDRPNVVFLVVESRSSRVQPDERAASQKWRLLNSDETQKIVMAEQSGRDVVDQTLSGGEPSPSGVPASISDKISAGGDGGKIQHITSNTQSSVPSDTQNSHQEADGQKTPMEETEDGKDSRTSATQTTGLVASRALELNGVASGSDGGDDTASLGGSESDASRTDGKHQNRAGSVKKPSAFKPVSFAKFAVPKAPGVTAAPKAPEKVPSTSTTPLGTPQPTSRPRLVAKTTTGMRDSFAKSGAGGGRPGATGPDPNQVWNKNRPVQPPPPKALTDEELKQQYGIHMTSRIQEDSGGTEAKWADIDDDEDDWAPETIEWNDGTKVTLTHTDHPPPAEQAVEQTPEETKSATPPARPEQPVVKDVVKIAAPKPAPSVGPNPTVLRLGANAERQAKAASISSKSANDKTPSGSTSPAPAPTKSPWAPLPPVERVSPINPPAQMSHQPRSAGPPPPSFHGDARQAPLPPQEIAADDFNRTWRESAPGAPRELYNSRSGRYEPVQENRRGSWRADQGPRPPAVLQRPNLAESGGPAEPSAAFQTYRSSHQDGMGWNRRRTSSNVSGGSGGYGRRTSFGRTDAPQRYMDGRRGSQTNGILDPALTADDTVISPETLPSQQRAGSGWTGQGRRNASAASSLEAPQPAPPVVPEAELEDPVVLQERIMKDARAQARQRRLEQEEKDRIEREERIKKKLAALGPPPEKTQRKESTEARKPQTPVAPAPATLHSPPKPPVPEPSGEPKQYGMMRVHHPDSVKKLVAANERDRVAEKSAEKIASPPHARRVPQSPRDHPTEITPSTSSVKPSPTERPSTESPKFEEPGAHWRGGLNVPSSHAPWTSEANLGSNAPSANNPWKLLSSDRTLGNGIFDQTLGGFPPRELPLRSQLGLDQASVPPPVFSGPQQSTSISPLPSPETRHAPVDSLSPIGRPGPIGPPSSHNNQWQQDSGPAGPLAWNNFHAITAQREKAIQEKVHREFIASKGKPNPMFAFKQLEESWAPARPGNDDTTQSTVGVATAPPTVRNNRNNLSSPHTLTGLETPPDAPPFSENHARSNVSLPARSSRFFPQASEAPKRSVTEAYSEQRSPSPPPPEDILTHPVYFGGAGRPLVHLPTPKPVVKLPPKALAAPIAPPTFASMAAAPPRGPGATASSGISWQEKINGLFGKKTPLEKKSALAITSASKEPLDVPLAVAAVSVSLPNHETDVHVGNGHLAVQQVEEQEEIFEDREPGSLPSVRVPNMAPANAWQAASAPPASRLRAKILRPMQVHSVEPYWFGYGEKDSLGNVQIMILLPGSETGKAVSMPKRLTSGPSYRQRNSPTFKPRKGAKPREASGVHMGAKKPSTSSHQQSSGTASSSPRHSSRAASWGPRNLSGPRSS
ncbi:hypothetical protein N7539_004383 [Penicillium diatomitis]|uniref:Uncharacterized protein n=1 Tax=Penicillium diatomitis TaxID=2819901 RepID=A0A9X0BYK1_9EURO|nr:uncharacterized protein N7539_004383 [Penicillium diatomitis]KAJ5489493.1 hypothetical protein N7539_004383 [Penicillium diatomitis]